MTSRNLLGTLLGLAIAGQALAAGVFYSEYIEGSSNNKAVEIYNGSGASINLANYVMTRSNNGDANPWANRFSFTGTLGSGCVFVIANSSANAAILAEADATSGLTFYNGDDRLGLYEVVGTDTICVDTIGELGVDPGAAWTVGSGATAEYTLRRMAGIVDGNCVWPGSGELEWDVFPQNDSADLGMHGSIGCAGNVNPEVSNVATIPAVPTEDDPVDVVADIIDVDGTVLMAELHWGLASNALTNVIAMQSIGGDAWQTMVQIPDLNACTVVYYQVVGTDDAMGQGSSPVLSYTVDCHLTIPQIQGATDVSPYENATVCTEGIVQRVVADRFFIQDGTAVRSGLTVFTGTAPTVLVGDLVEVCGLVDEYFNLTEMTNNPVVTVLGSGLPYAPVLLDAATAATEDYESMLVTVAALTVTAEQNNFGEFMLADGSGEIQADVDFFTIDPAPMLDDCYTLTGIQYYSFGAYTIFPTEAGDVVSCNVADAIDLVGSFSLNANYPNPFNPTTTIDFTLAQTAEMTLAVHDLAGRQVALLVNGIQSAGAHSVTFDASGLSSGVYFYTLSADGFQDTRKMVLLK
ncbi:MAG: T9SS type A sorting domain-containing protein [Candidatus Delongbacteria bacterium]|nr:T9SS type A sorting domain-containing protein [Candidatus Delongbacteria bacterium]